MKWLKQILISLVIALCAGISVAQAEDVEDEDDEFEETDVYYHGDIETVCAKAKSNNEMLIEAKGYCKAYPKNCIGSKAVCRNRMPVNAYTSKARENIYKSRLSSYKKNTKAVCKDFLWTCPDYAQKFEAKKETWSQNKSSSVLKKLPKTVVVCEDNEDCKENQECVTYDYLKTGTIKICKNTYHISCHHDLNCSNEQFCHQGKCIECLGKDMTCANPGMKCSNGKLVPDNDVLVPNFPCGAKVPGLNTGMCEMRINREERGVHYPCPEGYKKKILSYWGPKEYGDRCMCVLSGSDFKPKKVETFEFNQSCISNLDCLESEYCHAFYQKCVPADVSGDNLNSLFAEILELPNDAPNLSKSELMKKIEEQIKRLNEGPVWGKLSENQAQKYIQSHADLSTLNYFRAIIYLKDGTNHLKNAFKYMKLAADKGQKDAQFVLAMMYIHGQGTAVNENKGFWYLNHVFKPESKRQISRYAYMGALFELINCYQFGIGTEKNETKVEELKRLLLNASGNLSELESFYESTGMIRFCDADYSIDD